MNEDTAKSHTLPAYCSRIDAEKAAKLYADVLKQLNKRHRYRTATYNTRQLSADLGTNTRYISAAIMVCTGHNFNALVNGLRLRDVCRLMVMKQHANATVEFLGLLAGFSTRQSFYQAFRRTFGTTPTLFREQLKENGTDASSFTEIPFPHA